MTNRKNHLFRWIVLTGIYLICAWIEVHGGTPHSVFGKVEYTGGSIPQVMQITAYVKSRPVEILNQNSPGCGYIPSSGQWWIQCGNFPTNWQVGETLQVDFSDGASGTGTVELQLTANPADDAGITTLDRPEVQITIETDPHGLSFNVDNVEYDDEQTFYWEQNSQHTLSAPTSQNLSLVERYLFSAWSQGGNRVQVFVAPDQDSTLTASFDPQFRLETSVDPDTAGSIQKTPDKDWYDDGEAVTCQAIPSGNGLFHFVNWTGDVSSTSETVIIQMDQPKSIQANFDLNSYQIQVEILPNPNAGTVSLSPSLTEYVYNSIVDLVAHPTVGYRFDHWEGDLSGNELQKQITVLENVAVQAVFVRVDTAAPYIENPLPKPDAVQVAVNNPVEFRILDNMSGVASSTLDVAVAGVDIVQNGSDLTNGWVRINAIQNGYWVTYQPDPYLAEGETVDIEISCGDNAVPPNMFSTSYEFSVGNTILQITEQDTVYSQTSKTIEDSARLKIELSANAVAWNTVMTLGQCLNPPDLPDTLKTIGPCYFVGPDGLEFSGAVLLTLPIPDGAQQQAGVLSPENMQVVTYASSTGQWETLDISERTTNSIQVEIEHLSYYQIAAWTQSPSAIPIRGLAGAFNYPNPFNPESSPTYLCYRLAEDATISIKIFDIAGDLVKILVENETRTRSVMYRQVWDGKNELGEWVSNHVYFCVIESSTGDRTIQKIAVVR